MLFENELHVDNTRVSNPKEPIFHVAVQDLLLVLLAFGKGRTFNTALTVAANKALRFRERALKKEA